MLVSESDEPSNQTRRRLIRQKENTMKILVIDDSSMWIGFATEKLTAVGHEVRGIQVTDPKSFCSDELLEEVRAALADADVLLVDKDIGLGATSMRFVCVVRHNFPKLSIIRWSGGWDMTPYMPMLGVSTLCKPNMKDEHKFVGEFNEKLEEQRLIHAGPMAIFNALAETVSPNKDREEKRTKQLAELAQIAQLANQERVEREGWQGRREYWCLVGPDSGPTKHQLGHAICDNILTIEDIRPCFAALQKVVAKLEDERNIDARFEICADFIKAGDLERLELVRGCY